MRGRTVCIAESVSCLPSEGKTYHYVFHCHCDHIQKYSSPSTLFSLLNWNGYIQFLIYMYSWCCNAVSSLFIHLIIKLISLSWDIDIIRFFLTYIWCACLVRHIVIYWCVLHLGPLLLLVSSIFPKRGRHSITFSNQGPSHSDKRIREVINSLGSFES